MPHVSYFWDEMEDNVVEEYDGDTGNTFATHTTEPTLYGSVLSQDRSGEKRYFQFDGLGNTTELTDGAGNVTDERRYSAFGETTASSGAMSTPFEFGGRWGYHTSGGGNVSVRRRSCLMSLGRWSSTDPILVHGGSLANLYGYVDNRPTTFVDPSGWLKVAITARDFDRACGYYSVLWAVTPRAFERSAITAPPSPRSSGPRFVMGYVVQKVSIWNNVIDCRIQCPDTFFWDVSDWLPALKPDKVFWEALGPVLANGQQSVRDLSRNDMHLYEYGYHFGMGELRFFPVDDLGCLGRGTGDLSRDQNWKEVIPEANGLPATTTEPRFWNEPVDGPVLRIAGTRWSCCGPHAEWFNLPFALAGEQKK